MVIKKLVGCSSNGFWEQFDRKIKYRIMAKIKFSTISHGYDIVRLWPSLMIFI